MAEPTSPLRKVLEQERERGEGRQRGDRGRTEGGHMTEEGGGRWKIYVFLWGVGEERGREGRVQYNTSYHSRAIPSTLRPVFNCEVTAISSLCDHEICTSTSTTRAAALPAWSTQPSPIIHHRFLPHIRRRRLRSPAAASISAVLPCPRPYLCWARCPRSSCYGYPPRCCLRDSTKK